MLRERFALSDYERLPRRGRSRRRNRIRADTSICAEHGGEGAALTLGERPDLLVLGHSERDQQPPAPGAPPTALAHEQVADRHARGLPRAVEDHLTRRDLLCGYLALQLGTGQPHPIRACERVQVLLTATGRRSVPHLVLPENWLAFRTSRHTALGRNEQPRWSGASASLQASRTRVLQATGGNLSRPASGINSHTGLRPAKSGLFIFRPFRSYGPRTAT